MPLDPDIAMLIIEIDANLSHAESITHGLTPAQLEWRPEPGRWSIGECVAHLNLVNGPALAPIETAIAAGRARNQTGEGPFPYGFITRKIIASREPPVTKKTKAPKFLLPANVDPEATLAEYRRISSELKRLAREASGLNLRKVRVTLPVLPSLLQHLIKMPLGGRIAFLTTHDRRHLWQAEQVRYDANFPA